MELPDGARLGLGTFDLAGGEGDAAAEQQRLAAALRLVAERLASAGGFAHLDTAPDEGDGERVLGRCFDASPALRSRFHVATGWGLRRPAPEPHAEDYSLAGLRDSLETSGRRLHGVDLLYLRTHSGVDVDRLRWLLRGGDGCIERMRDLRKRRLHGITQLGLALFRREAAELVARAPELLAGFDVLQLAASAAAGDGELAARLQALAIRLVLRPPLPGEGAPLPGALVLSGVRDLARTLERARRGAAPAPLELAYAAEGTPAAEASAIEDALAAHLAPEPEEPAGAEAGGTGDPAAIAARIASALIGTRRTRLGPAPIGRSLATLRARIEGHVARALPVDVILTWGPRKFHASRDESRVDVAELAALARLAAFQAEVRRIHPPGLRYALFYEDLEGAFIEGEDDGAFWPYGAGLVRLANALAGPEQLRVIATRGLLRRFDPAEVEARLAENHAALGAHWRGEAGAAAAERLGFAGGIDPASRRFYVGRLDRLLADRRTPEQKQDMVIRLFAAVLLHRQLDMFRLRPDLEPVKLSFLPLAGGPASLADGRVDVRSIALDLCKHSLAPWSAKGYLRRRGGAVQPATKPWPEPLPDGTRLLRGDLRLRRGEAAAELRADRLAPGP